MAFQGYSLLAINGHCIMNVLVAHYVSDPLPRHCGIIVALDSSEP